MLKELLDQKKIIVCVGSGGVGKTTVSASLALAAALEGKKSLVMTIDPAKRLADALGLEMKENRELQVSPELFEKANLSTDGQLYAMMHDHKKTFDLLIQRYSPSPESAERLIANPWYQQMSSGLVGAQDFMAVEKLYELIESNEYDIIILDTPPTSNALDFLNAPEKMLGLLKFQPIQWVKGKFSQEEGEAKGTTNRFFRWGGSALIQVLGKVTGKEVIEEVSKLLQDLGELYDGFAERAENVWKLLRSDQSAFLLISAPERQQLEEALFFQKKLLEDEIPFYGFLLNRTKGYYDLGEKWQQLPEIPPSEEQKQIFLQKFSDQSDPLNESSAIMLNELSEHLEKQQKEAEQCWKNVVSLKNQMQENTFLGLLPAIQDEIHDLAGLARMSKILLENGLDLPHLREEALSSQEQLSTLLQVDD